MDQLNNFHEAVLKELIQENADSGVSLDEAFFERMTGLLEYEGEIATSDRIGFSGQNSQNVIWIWNRYLGYVDALRQFHIVTHENIDPM